ncbi:hypothetical protein [Catellatospora chokoriensis]|uniref:Uncharacterized protein n=1 Tax=Catellatospora chokoriensis TaxID=310353 RepID=A0A8J3JXS1_9ACTN|nr:hypothetical protein [Catellatospora chokoriensis]GIF86943.1 hypothetical protein Cch02nite_03870 [Catellatospora chokoriensis]
MRRWTTVLLLALALTAGCSKQQEAGAAGAWGSPADPSAAAQAADTGVGTAQPGAVATTAAPTTAPAPTAGTVAASTGADAPVPTGRKEIVRFAVPVGDWQRVFDQVVAAGYRLAYSDGYEVGGQTFLNGVFRPADGTAWQSRHNLSASTYQTTFEQMKAGGYRLSHLTSYLVGGQIRYGAIWRKAAGPAWVAYHGLTQAKHQERITDLTAQGYHPVAISVASPGGTPQWAALYVKESAGSWLAKSWLTPAEYQQQFDAAAAKGMRVVYLSATQDGTGVRLSVIFQSGTGAYQGRHGITAAEVADQAGTNAAAGRLTRAVAGYATDGSARFAAAWS